MKRVGEYVLQDSPLGSGAFGAVYLGRNRYDGSYCAVKTVTQNVGRAELEGVRSYAEEIDDHEHLLPVSHVGKLAGNSYYFVMPLADDSRGRPLRPPPRNYQPMTLAKYIRDKAPLPFDEIASIADRLSLGVKRLHTAGLVHCDIKPANIVRLDGKWRIGDFGITVRRTHRAGGPGTPWFLPPEGSGDFSGDIYSLGKTLLVLASGMDPPSQTVDPDPFDLFRNGKLRLPYRDTRKTKLEEIIRHSTTNAPSERLVLAEFHEQITELIRKKRVIVEVQGDVDVQMIQRALQLLGLVVPSVNIEVL